MVVITYARLIIVVIGGAAVHIWLMMMTIDCQIGFFLFNCLSTSQTFQLEIQFKLLLSFTSQTKTYLLS